VANAVFRDTLIMKKNVDNDGLEGYLLVIGTGAWTIFTMANLLSHLCTVFCNCNKVNVVSHFPVA